MSEAALAPQGRSQQRRRQQPPQLSQQQQQQIEEANERQQTRLKYRQLIDSASEQSAELCDPTKPALVSTLQAARTLFDRVNKPREAVLDSEFIKKVSEYGTEQVLRLQTAVKAYDPQAFVAHVREKLSELGAPEPPSAPSLAHWAALGRTPAIGKWRTAPSIEVLYGPITPDEAIAAQQREQQREQQQQQQEQEAAAAAPKQRRTRQQKEKGEAERPMDVKALDEQAKAETAGRVRDVLERLVQEDGECADYWAFVTNPDSYGQTIENIFFTSFLVKDGLASLNVDDGTGKLRLARRDPPQQGAAASRRKQCIMSLSYADWSRLRTVYTKAMLPTRKPQPQTPEPDPQQQRATTTTTIATMPIRASQSTQRSTRAKAQRRSRGSDENEDGDEDSETEQPRLKGKRSRASQVIAAASENVDCDEDNDSDGEEVHLIDRRFQVPATQQR